MMARGTGEGIPFFRQYLILLGKDLRQEFRTREMLTSMGLYALLVIIVYGSFHLLERS